MKLLQERLRSISAKPQLCCHFETSSTERPVVGFYSETKLPFHGDKLKMKAKASGQGPCRDRVAGHLVGFGPYVHISGHI